MKLVLGGASPVQRSHAALFNQTLDMLVVSRRRRQTTFALRCDEAIAYWHLLLAGAGLGLVRIILAARCSCLQQVEIGLRIPPMSVWLVMSEEVPSNARVRRVADHLSAEIETMLDARPA